MAQFVQAELSTQEVSSLILSDSNFCIVFLVEKRTGRGRWVKCALNATSLSVNYSHVLPLLKKATLPLSLTPFPLPPVKTKATATEFYIKCSFIHRIHKAWGEHGVEALWTGKKNILLSCPKMPRLHARSRLYELGI